MFTIQEGSKAVRENTKKVPEHIAFIMDGNSRWAQSRGQRVSAGHRAGADALRRTIDVGRRRGTKAMTFFAFSTENWRRGKTEVSLLMNLAALYFEKFAHEAIENDIRIRIVGDHKDKRIPPRLKEAILQVEEATLLCGSMDVNIAFNYGGEDDILHATKSIAALVAKDELKASDLNQFVLRQHLYSHGVPDVDLLIRTSGELRLSNFLPIQTKYAELYFTPTLWPDFDEADFDEALAAYAGRDRRMGERHGELIAAE
jgi:undecaprenyl diphosphate synthase